MGKIKESLESDVFDDDIYMYTGQNFRIRETREEDIVSWYKWFNDADITKYMMHGVFPNTIEKQREFRLRNLNGDSKVMFSIVDKNSPELIGTCSININWSWADRHAEISLVLGNKKYHNGPLYLEITAWQLDHAFFAMNMHSVFTCAREENKAVIGTLGLLKFNTVGVIRECSYVDGKYYNCVMQDILKEEWSRFKEDN